MAKNVAHTRTQAELEAELAEQLAALRKLSADFDGGEMWAAKLLATVVSVLCHDGRQDVKSLLGQLGIRDTLQCVNTAFPASPGNLMHQNTLIAIQFGAGGGVRQVPLYQGTEAEAHPKVPFTEWWGGPVFVGNAPASVEVARWQLVYFLRSQDGGSHYDATLSSEQYLILKEGGGWQMVSGGQKQPLEPVHAISMRAIAWELDQSLRALGH